jgi:ribonuclease-3
LSVIPSLVFNERTVVFCEFAENDRNVTPLEERIGYKFRNSLLLAEALTHPSLGHEAQRYHFDYQRLEFLGDAVLQLVITEYLFRNFRIEAEGQLTKLRSRLVSREALRMHAAALDLGRYILMGRGEESSGGRERTSTLADAFEALIGALYLDGGLDVAKEFILTQTRADLDELAEKPVDINPKGDLQELLQSISPQSPVYELISQTGPEHEKTFVSQVVWEGIVLGQGSGRSKKHAETAAAIEAMQLRRWEEKRENETA